MEVQDCDRQIYFKKKFSDICVELNLILVGVHNNRGAKGLL